MASLPIAGIVSSNMFVKLVNVNNFGIRWRKFVEAEAPEKEKFPQEWKKKDALQRLCMMRALRPDRMLYAVQASVHRTSCIRAMLISELSPGLYPDAAADSDHCMNVFVCLSFIFVFVFCICTLYLSLSLSLSVPFLLSFLFHVDLHHYFCNSN